MSPDPHSARLLLVPSNFPGLCTQAKITELPPSVAPNYYQTKWVTPCSKANLTWSVVKERQLLQVPRARRPAHVQKTSFITQGKVLRTVRERRGNQQTRDPNLVYSTHTPPHPYHTPPNTMKPFMGPPKLMLSHTSHKGEPFSHHQCFSPQSPEKILPITGLLLQFPEQRVSGISGPKAPYSINNICL